MVIARLAILFVAFALTACNEEPTATDQQRICIARLYPNYNEKNLDQCMSACKSCRGGNTVTCSTSCKLKGAN